MAFATVSDIAARLEVTSLSATQQTDATALLTTASAIISAAVDETTESWFSTLPTGTSALVKGLTVEMVVRAMASPQGLTAASERLGEYERSESYGRDDALTLTKTQELILRRAVFGRTTDSVTVGSHFQEVADD